MFVPYENRIKIDAHGMTVEEIKYELDITLDYLQDNIKQIVVVHGYKYGQTILNYVRNIYNHPNIISVEMDKNPGITLLNVKAKYIKDIGK